MSETLQVIRERRSCKSYKPDMIPEEVIQTIAEAGTWAPSGMGRQSAIIVAITNKELRDRLSRMNAQIMGADMDPFYGAPVVLVVLADKKVPTHVYDGALVMENLLLAAADLGIGSCWIHRAKEEFESAEGKEILKALGIEGDYEGIGHCILGYPAAEPKEAAAPVRQETPREEPAEMAEMEPEELEEDPLGGEPAEDEELQVEEDFFTSPLPSLSALKEKMKRRGRPRDPEVDERAVEESVRTAMEEMDEDQEPLFQSSPEEETRVINLDDLQFGRNYKRDQ